MTYAMNVKEASFALGTNPPDFDTIISFDLAGRMIGAYLREPDGREANFRRGFDNRVIRLVKDATLRNRWIEELPALERDELLARCFEIVRQAQERGRWNQTERGLLGRAAANGPAELDRQREQFLSIYGSVPILPPDQYRAVVLQVTRGCPFNECDFCFFYRGCEFRVLGGPDFDAHLKAVRSFFGESLRLRQSVFLGDANAVLVPTRVLLERMQQARLVFEIAPPDLTPREEAAWRREHPCGLVGFYSFLDGLSGARKRLDDYRELAAAGLKRVYIGAESGCDEFLERVRKPCRREQVVETVRLCKQAGVAVGLIFLAGIGQDDPPLAERHVEETLSLATSLPLGAGDLIYLSPYVPERGAAPCLPSFVEAQLDGLESRLRASVGGCRVVVYDIRGFIY